MRGRGGRARGSLHSTSRLRALLGWRPMAQSSRRHRHGQGSAHLLRGGRSLARTSPGACSARALSRRCLVRPLLSTCHSSNLASSD